MLRNILSIPAGFILGSVVNMSLIMIGGAVIPPPDGADVTSMESLKASMHLFGPEHFLFPFLAHALGTLAGAVVVAAIATTYPARFALAIGVLFLIGGGVNIAMIGGPMWFNAVDLIAAYLPMGYLGGWIVLQTRAAANASST